MSIVETVLMQQGLETLHTFRKFPDIWVALGLCQLRLTQFMELCGLTTACWLV